MQYLRADTITEVTIGPAVAVGDGFTPVTTLSIAGADEAELIKHGATTTTAIAGTLAAITGADGYYSLDLSATDTNTEGRLTLLINDDSLILPIRHEFMVVNTNVFDSLFAAAATDVLDVNVTQLAGTTQDATDLADFAAAGYDPATNKVQGVVLVDTTTTNTDMRGTDSALLAASAPANFGDLAITATTGLVDITQTAADKVWSTATRLLTAGTNIVLAKGVGLTGLNDVSTAEVNTEVLDVMNTDTITLPGQEAPPLAPTHRQAIAWLYKVFRNRKTQTSTQWSLLADDETTVDAKATVSDDGTTAIKQEVVTGP